MVIGTREARAPVVNSESPASHFLPAPLGGGMSGLPRELSTTYDSPLMVVKWVRYVADGVIPSALPTADTGRCERVLTGPLSSGGAIRPS